MSVLYHALQSGGTIQAYIDDASGDQELADFLREVQDQDRQRAEKAKRLLDARLGG